MSQSFFVYDGVDLERERVDFEHAVGKLSRTSSRASIDDLLDQDGYVRQDIGLNILGVLSGDVIMPENSSKRIICSPSGELEPRYQNMTGISGGEDWEYPGWGVFTTTKMPPEMLPKIHPRHCLDTMRSTAIAGNDLFASVLYTTGLVCAVSGQLAPIAMFICVCSLYPFRKILQENGTAVPLNGGVYTQLLNSSSKFTATFAATCSLISYSATAVVSAASCTAYAAAAFGEFPVLPVTVAILFVFALLVLCGVKDSANVAALIFSIHLLTLLILIITSLVKICQNGGSVWHENLHAPLPVNKSGGIGLDLFLGFSVSLLGLTGFETSPNYIEEAGPFETERTKVGPTRAISVFEKTLNYMYALVVFINPTIAACTLGVVSLADITSNTSIILSVVGARAGGPWLQYLVSIDAIIVLAGGVLTAFVGVAGLIKQLASDRCFPSFLLIQNERFGTYHWAILGFLILSSTLYLITGGDVTILSGVFSLAFLLVLIMFAFANIQLKFNRPRLPRGARIGWPGVLLGLSTMIIGFIGNVITNVDTLGYLMIFVSFFISIILISFQRVAFAKFLLYFCRQIPYFDRHFSSRLIALLVEMRKFTVVFFAKTSELHILNEAIIYARDNEMCERIIFVHVQSPDDFRDIPNRLRENLYILDQIYPKIKVDINIVEADEFNPQLVEALSIEFKVKPTFMFIRSPGRNFKYNIGDFNGVRSIMN